MTNKQITKEDSYRAIAVAILSQSVSDFVHGTPRTRKAIIKDLRSTYMETITNGLSIVVADQMEFHPEQIKEELL